MEILISLCVLMTISLSLLNEQIVIKRRLHATQHQGLADLAQDNQAERQYFQSSKDVLR